MRSYNLKSVFILVDQLQSCLFAFFFFAVMGLDFKTIYVPFYRLVTNFGMNSEVIGIHMLYHSPKCNRNARKVLYGLSIALKLIIPLSAITTFVAFVVGYATQCIGFGDND